MPEDTSGKDLLRNRIASVLDEAISSTADLNDYGDELEAYANAVIEGLGLGVTYENADLVLTSGAYHKAA